MKIYVLFSAVFAKALLIWLTKSSYFADSR